MRSALLFSLAMALPMAAIAAPSSYVSYTFDGHQTLPQFAIDRLGFGKLQGFFAKTSGRIVVDRNAQTGAMELAVQTGSIYLGEPTRANRRAASEDDSSRAPGFLKSDVHPTMVLKAKQIRFEGAQPTVADAEITFVGITRPIALQLERWQCDRLPNGAETCAGVASATIRRSAFGVTLGYPLVADDVVLRIDLRGVRD